jgi:hypothetical protein
MQGTQAPGGPLGMPAGFVASLFDMKFRNLITLRVIEFLYWLILIVATLSALGSLVAGLFSGGPLRIILTLILTPLFYLLEIVFARVGLEILLVIFRMADDVQAMRYGGAVPAGASYATGAAQPSQYQSPQYQQYQQQQPEPQPQYQQYVQQQPEPSQQPAPHQQPPQQQPDAPQQPAPPSAQDPGQPSGSDAGVDETQTIVAGVDETQTIATDDDEPWIT